MRRLVTPRVLVVAAALVVATVGQAVGQPAADRLASLRQLLREARFAEAEAGARGLLADSEAAHGPGSVQAAAALDVLVEALWRGGRVRTSEARSLAERALAIVEARLGPDHPEVANRLGALGQVLRLQGEFAAAQSRLQRALELQEQALGPEHPDVARTLTLSAGLAADMGELPAARERFERALAIGRQRLAAGDPAIADTLNGLGVVLEREGDDRGAERLHQQALAIRERALGGAHPDVAVSLNNLGNAQSNLGRYAEARRLHQRALEIRERALGVDHPDVAASLNNLAVDLRDLGDHAAAWWLLERVLGIYQKRLGDGHPNVGFVHHNLATILLDLGEAAGARLIAERARRARGRDPAARAALTASLNPLIGGTPPPGALEAARALFERALAIKEAALGPVHPSVAVTLTSLATVLGRLKRWEAAGVHYERALAIRERALGPQHPDLAETLDRFGESLIDRGDDHAARRVFERVLAILEPVYGPDHPHVGAARGHLAELLARTGETGPALEMALETERIGRDHLAATGVVLPEHEALMYAAARPVGLDVALTIVARAGEMAQAWRSRVWDALVRSRAAVLDEMARRQRSLHARNEPEVARLLDDLAARRDGLAKLVARGPGSDRAEYRAAIAHAREARDRSERALAERSALFEAARIQRRVGLDDVRAALPPRSAVIAFVRYAERPSQVAAPGSRSQPREAYLAFVMRSGDAGAPALVPIGDAAAVDRAVATWRRQIRSIAFAGGRSTVRAEAVARQAGTRLRRRIWDPLATHTGGATRVFIVPDGALHLVTWDALPAPGGAYLVERAPLFHYVSAERDLVEGPPAPPGRGLLVVDSPAFDGTPAGAGRRARASVPRRAERRPGESPALRSTGGDCSGLSSMRFDPLPASGREAATIATIWRQAPHAVAQEAFDRLSGAAATEAAVKERAAGARVLHLATHGFFLGGRCAAGIEASSSAHDRGAATGTGNPLLLAGVALAGANRRHAAGAGDEDGILTAEEVASLDLRSVEWVVLSACDSGVGEVRAGEGVFGLRRAFQVAGARTLIMSLWPVDDEDALRWMAGVYDRRFRRGATTVEAVRAASLEQLRRRRRAGASTHPFYWAAFIAAGGWR
jgi:CHAT domain-containing protein/tetratricopeptide (TPR) repeat protein